MDNFKRIDDALQRLNATLDSYKIKSTPPSETVHAPQAPKRDPEMDRKWMGARDDHYEEDIKLFKYLDELFDIHDTFRSDIDLTTKEYYPHITNLELRIRLNRLHDLFLKHLKIPTSISLCYQIGQAYVDLGYPDLAAGSAYKALLLMDAFKDESDENHERVVRDTFDNVRSQPLHLRMTVAKTNPEISSRLSPNTLRRTKSGAWVVPPPKMDELNMWVSRRWGLNVLVMLSQCLYACGCYRSAMKYCMMGLKVDPKPPSLRDTREAIMIAVLEHPTIEAKYGRYKGGSPNIPVEEWPDQGMVRREHYPWNNVYPGPNRSSDENLMVLNRYMEDVAPKLEVRVTELPDLSGYAASKDSVTRQLGVFAKEDIHPGEIILQERSMLTANNRLHDTLCDACSCDLPDTASSGTVGCDDCEAVFCSKECYDRAIKLYHPAICDRDVDSIARDVEPAQAADSLYLLLLLRTLAMAHHTADPALSQFPVRYVWGDYHNMSLDSNFKPLQDLPDEDPFLGFPRTLPWDFNTNVVQPFNMLMKMDADFFQEPEEFDVWIFNTLFAKYRGTASARLSGNGGGRIRGPEVSAVHPLWCLANHDCDPNVKWEWGGLMEFQCREERVEWVREEPVEGGTTTTRKTVRKAGIKKGEEILSHYCDINLPVHERRAWAAGALGGACRCDRCKWEAGETTTAS